jgi:hypothetical protein
MAFDLENFRIWEVLNFASKSISLVGLQCLEDWLEWETLEAGSFAAFASGRKPFSLGPTLVKGCAKAVLLNQLKTKLEPP